MVTDVEEETARVVIVKVAVVLPAATVMDVGTVAVEVLLLDSVTTVPPVGADPDRVTVACDVIPPVTEVGLKPKELNAGGATVNIAVFDAPLKVAVMVTDVEEETAKVVKVKVAVVLPAGIVMEAGTVAAEVLLLDNATTIPPVGADPDKVNVP